MKKAQSFRGVMTLLVGVLPTLLLATTCQAQESGEPEAYADPRIPPEVLAQRRERRLEREKLRKEVEECLRKGKYDRAITLCRTMAGTSFEANFNPSLAEAYRRKGDLTQAIAVYRTMFYPAPGETVASYGTNNPTSRMYFVLALYQAGLTEEALKNYLEGVKLTPEDGSAFWALSVNPQEAQSRKLPYAAHLIIAMSQLGWDDEIALASARLAVKMRPNTAVGYYGLAQALRRFSDKPEYAKEYMEARRKLTALADPALRKVLEGGDLLVYENSGAAQPNTP
jgi:tetratricopeptide (TPR) repeat protein